MKAWERREKASKARLLFFQHPWPPLPCNLNLALLTTPFPLLSISLNALQTHHLTQTDNDGKLTGADAVAFFERSGLPRTTLAKVWTLADAGRRGFLDKKGFAKAMELIGIAQRSPHEDLSAEAYAEAAARADLDPPVLEGVGGGGGGGKASAAATGGSDDGGGGEAQPSPRGTAAAAASPSGSGAPSPQQQYAYAQQQGQQGNGRGPTPSLGGAGGRGSQQQPSMKTITGVVDGLKQIYFSKGTGS